MDRRRITVIIPAYNEERYLVACLDSVAAQTVKPYQVIVVDNNSIDRTVSIATSYSFVTILHEPRQGIVFARNTGFNAATGDIIARTDADVILSPTWVETILRFYENADNHGTAWSGAAQFHNVHFSKLISSVYNLFTFHFNKILMGGALWGSSMALPTSMWRSIRGEVHQRIDIHEDLDLAIHLLRHKYLLHYNPTHLVQAELKRIYTGRNELWDYLMWWPRTLRIHDIWTWPVCWFFGGLLLYVGTVFLVILEPIAKLFDKPVPRN